MIDAFMLHSGPADLARALLERRIDYFTAYVCENLGSRDERVTRGTLAEIAGHRAKVGGPRIFGVVHAVAEARNLFLLGQHSLHIFHRIGTRTIDGFQDVEHSFVGSAVQRSL